MHLGAYFPRFAGFGEASPGAKTGEIVCCYRPIEIGYAAGALVHIDPHFTQISRIIYHFMELVVGSPAELCAGRRCRATASKRSLGNQ
jgi:hypothetical protein